jgi:UDP-N-acetylglucosamine transferase subunit ALG13
LAGESRHRSALRAPIVLAASGGGHLDLLVRIRSVADEHERIWLTSPGSRADQLEAEGERVVTVDPMDRTKLSASNPSRSALLALRLRPRVVITSGAGMVAPFCQAAKLLGSRILFVETMARVTSPSTGGLLISRMADEVFVQWPELLAFYPWATLCRPALIDIGRPTPTERRAKRGTFLAVGTHHEPFDRLLRMAGEAAAKGLLPAPVIAQSGASEHHPRGFEGGSWLDPDAFRRQLAAARVVIGHAGSGLVSNALAAGTRPLILARRRAFDEHVDDHQIQIARKLEQLGLAVRLGLAVGPGDVRAAAQPLPEDDPFGELPTLEERLGATLRRIAPVRRAA